MSEFGDGALRRNLRAGLERMAAEAAALAGIAMSIEGKAVRPGRGDARVALGGPCFRVPARLAGTEREAGFIFPAGALTACGAALMLIPPPSSVTREILAAFDELTATMLRAWNAAVGTAYGLLVEPGEHRVLAMDEAELAALAARPDRALALAPFHVAGGDATMAIYGPPDWLALDQATPPSAETRAVPAVPLAAPTAEGYVLVDETGILGEWLRQRLNAGDLRVYRRRADEPPAAGATVVMVNASNDQLRAAAATDWLVMRR